ncbi:hypothetical protein IQ249_21920 [Lusitaniella coriacea LEGE 07157]|uniref:Uncharacterized protein n=1 Tax=Lusitaniella coriacea LEGE 07157 TaxID=945747 RepID=A0A8J7E054_9CYAN|nr:hypothetical protein [Lusitaniella coriacea]MBE9118550.1 hypothetical protein [Lusitaniella coriacea LEGE 07157]
MKQNLREHLIGISLGFGLSALVLLLLSLDGGYPSSAFLAKRYFRAILQQKEERAVNLLNRGCGFSTRTVAQDNITQFGGSKVRNMTINVQNGMGSDDRYQLASIHFEYRRNSSADWETGRFGIGTTANSWGIRYLVCGG